jgi:hydroxymethylpyrimidine/phosphomethylpyrimidine kinase
MANGKDRRSSAATALALTIAGSDSSAGAGIQADLKTFSALGVYGVCAVTCVVAETPGKVLSIHPVEPGAVRDQLEVLLSHFEIGAVKTGLLHSAEIVIEVARALRDFIARTSRALPLVIDPVMVATTGDLLLQREAIAAYEQELFPLAAVVTPNLDEAATLTGTRITDVSGMRVAGEELARRYGVPFLVKGGHLSGASATDLLFEGRNVCEFNAPFTRGVATHGTGCTYSAAIAAGLAAGLPLERAIERAKTYVSRAIADHFTWHMADGATIHALNHAVTRA